jgi:glycosyltransferase involved in cell wall biosynthesis
MLHGKTLFGGGKTNYADRDQAVTEKSAIVLSLFHIHPVRIDGTMMFARSLSIALGEAGFCSVLCFPSEPHAVLSGFFSLANVTVAIEPLLFAGGFAQSWCFFRLLAKYRPAIVHVHFMGLVSSLPWLAQIGGVQRFFFTDHNSRPEAATAEPTPRWKRHAREILTSPIDRVVSVSEYVLLSHLAAGSFPPGRLRLIYNGVDVDRAAVAARTPQNFRLRFSIPADRTVITQVSWLIEEKGVSDLVAAAGIVVAACPDVHFCIVGAGPFLPDAVREVSAAGLTSRFTFTGELSDPLFDGVYTASDIICQPSRWQEAFGWVIAEAMAFRRPVLATRVGGIPEIVRDHVTGFLVSPRDVMELSRRLIELASSPALRERMGGEGYTEVLNRFALNVHIQEHLEVYGIVPEGGSAGETRGASAAASIDLLPLNSRAKRRTTIGTS